MSFTKLGGLESREVQELDFVFLTLLEYTFIFSNYFQLPVVMWGFYWEATSSGKCPPKFMLRLLTFRTSKHLDSHVRSWEDSQCGSCPKWLGHRGEEADWSPAEVVKGLVLVEQQHLLQKTIHTGIARVRTHICSQWKRRNVGQTLLSAGKYKYVKHVPRFMLSVLGWGECPVWA